MAPRPCIEPGCPGYALPGPRHSRCLPHQRAWDRARNHRPGRQAYKDPAYRAVPLAGWCVDCGATTDLTRDHDRELHQGGTSDPGNLVIRCLTCNLIKSNRIRRETKHET